MTHSHLSREASGPVGRLRAQRERRLAIVGVVVEGLGFNVREERSGIHFAVWQRKPEDKGILDGAKYRASRIDPRVKGAAVRGLLSDS